jgi:hypothetical protein
MDKETVIKDVILYAAGAIGERETPPKSNRSALIDRIQQPFGLIGQQYCVMFVLWCYMKTLERLKLRFPFSKTASSQTLYENCKKKGWTTTNFSEVQPGDIMIFRKYHTWTGHAALVVDVEKDSVTTIEGNTSNSNFGNQSDGDGIWKRKRPVNLSEFTADDWYIRGFIQVRKALEI